MNLHLFEQLHKAGLVSEFSMEKIRARQSTRLFSVHWELRTFLYFGIVLLTAGLGVLVYKNIDSLSHEVILILIVAACAGCFFYCVRKKLPFSAARVSSPNPYFDYTLLLGCLLFITLITYLQAQYVLFGTAYGMATFIPMMVLFFSAYYFDHLGILCMAITNMAAWFGIAVAPLSILRDNDFSNGRLIFAAVALGALLVALSVASSRRRIKAHFAFTYLNFGMHLLYIGTLAGMFHFERYSFVWALPLAAKGYYFYRQALTRRSFYVILIMTIYCYVGITYLVYRVISYMQALFEFGQLYCVGSGVLVILFLVRMNKKFKRHDCV